VKWQHILAVGDDETEDRRKVDEEKVNLI